ncbi:uncharacterized protein MYCFIDRAFT_208263 [Pseudocercospora fijiensis CIRAD86]|uniref:F-box domain-containing protein n=1 Tax=Pseudocercospora fijiensis (strain CIRAD86) TaxID=383855 RepID=M2ZPZ1_PSEFD|nr:uncharacterized protein MYCFIDRAFT_208263 [Pseudocercospora fijiensis CIRAD86]EME81144.1 hypothetical protein MYCFIDRAFT_208263 [Pseudocercospora fijiensis CIRAD86]
MCFGVEWLSGLLRNAAKTGRSWLSAQRAWNQNVSDGGSSWADIRCWLPILKSDMVGEFRPESLDASDEQWSLDFLMQTSGQVRMESQDLLSRSRVVVTTTCHVTESEASLNLALATSFPAYAAPLFAVAGCTCHLHHRIMNWRAVREFIQHMGDSAADCCRSHTVLGQGAARKLPQVTLAEAQEYSRSLQNTPPPRKELINDKTPSVGISQGRRCDGGDVVEKIGSSPSFFPSTSLPHLPPRTALHILSDVADNCEAQSRIAQAARTALFPPPILPTGSQQTRQRRNLGASATLKRKAYDLAPSIHIFAHSDLTDAVAVNMTAELARLHRDVKVDLNGTINRSRASHDQTPAHQFHRFFDLPAEIRNYIYEHVVSKDSVLRLRCFVLPGICRTSQQLRQESLPIFFAQNHFVAEVKTNFEGISACPTHGSHAQYITFHDFFRFKLAGKLDLNRVVDKMLRLCHPKLIKVKNIDFCMMAVNRRKRRDEQYRYAILSVRDGRLDKVSTHIKEGNDPEYTKHLKRVLSQGRTVLDQITSDPDYAGLDMTQLRDVAATFVADPNERMSRRRPRQNAATAVHPHRSLDSGDKEENADEFDLPEPETYFHEVAVSDGNEFALANAELRFT